MSQVPKSWLPTRAALRAEGLYLAVRQIAPDLLADPFLQQTVDRVPGPESVLQIARRDLGRGLPAAAPAGLIFHVSRCGSTLVSQLLKQALNVVVYAEPQAINEILLPPHPWPRAEMVAALRSMAPVFAQHAARPYALKLSSWNLLFADLLLEAYPGTPWVLCLRDPTEVVVSLRQETPGWLQEGNEPAQRLAQFVDPAGSSRDRDEYVARAVGALCSASANLAAQRGRLIQYSRLPSAVWTDIAPHFGIPVDSAAQHRMTEAALLESKAPVGRASRFRGDSDAKQAAATANTRRAVDEFARPAFDRLTRRG